MKKKTFLKSLSFTSLALLMGAAGVFAFAPLGASPNTLANASEISHDINTRADGENIKYAPSPLGLDPENDPVIYTTESGLEIKYGGVSVNNSSTSWRLAGYPYFTMGTYKGYAVNWVIIGRNTNDTVFTNAITYHLFSSWKTNNGSFQSATFKNNGDLFFKNTYESTTPAGSAINGVVPSKSYVADVTKATKTVVGNTEIPSGCVLAISECSLGFSYFNCPSSYSDTTYWQVGSSNYGGRYRYLSTSGAGDAQGTTYSYSTNPGTLYTYINNLYSTNLGLSTTQKQLIKPQKLITAYVNGMTAYLETYNTDGNTLYNMFPLACYKYGAYYSSSNNPGDENFVINTYLTTNELRQAYLIGTTTAYGYWLRSSECTYSGCGAVAARDKTADGVIDGYWARYTHAVRPACVIKLG